MNPVSEAAVSYTDYTTGLWDSDLAELAKKYPGITIGGSSSGITKVGIPSGLVVTEKEIELFIRDLESFRGYSLTLQFEEI